MAAQETTGSLIKMTHRISGQVVYLGAVQTGDERTPFEPIARTLEFETTPFHSLEDAREHTFPDADGAAAVLNDMPEFHETKNIEYEIVEVQLRVAPENPS